MSPDQVGVLSMVGGVVSGGTSLWMIYYTLRHLRPRSQFDKAIIPKRSRLREATEHSLMMVAIGILFFLASYLLWPVSTPSEQTQISSATPDQQPSLPSETIDCRPSAGRFAANLCGEIQGLDRTDLAQCFQMDPHDRLEIDVEVTDQSNQLSVAEHLYDINFQTSLHRSSKLKYKGLFSVHDVSSIASARKRFIDHTLTLCQLAD